MYQLQEAAEALDLYVMPVGVELDSTDLENPGSDPDSAPYPVTTTEFVAYGFEAEVCGCKVSAQFKKPIILSERRTLPDGEQVWRGDASPAFMDAVRHVWPGVDAHI